VETFHVINNADGLVYSMLCYGHSCYSTANLTEITDIRTQTV